jgi:drug/metabolite transporter (DMT)-like permease
LILGFAGIVYLVLSTEKVSAEEESFIGSAAIIFGALSWGSGAVYARVAKLPKSAMLSAGIELIIGGSLLLLAGFLLNEGSRIHIDELPLRAVLSLV